MPKPENIAVRTKAAAEMLGVSERTIRSWVARGHLKATKIENTVLIPVSELDRITGQEAA